MNSAACARCGGDLPDEPGNRHDISAPPPFDKSIDLGWASFDGQTVCPECQSADERREVAERIVRMVDREIKRRQAAGVPPDRHEAPLVAYVMGLRDAAGGPHDEGTSESAAAVSGDSSNDPAGSEDPSFRRDRATDEDAAEGHRRNLRVAVTGAFLTGVPLTARLDGYDALQGRLAGKLMPPQWQTKGLRVNDGTYESGGGFTDDVPLEIARRDGADFLPWLHSTPRASGSCSAPELARFWPLTAANVRHVAVRIYDLGVGVVTAWLEVTMEPGAPLDETVRAVRRLVRLRTVGDRNRALPVVFQRIADRVTTEYREAVEALPEAERQRPWLSRALPSAENGKRPTDDEEGRLLWLHPINILHATGSARVLAAQMAPAFHSTIDLQGGVFAPGVGWSAVVVADEAAAETPIRLTELHWAYYALYMAIDRGLLQILNQPGWSERAPLGQLEAEAEDVFADYMRVSDSRARLDSHLSSLGGDELAIWEQIATTQRFEAVVAGVDRKLEALEKVADRRVAQATAHRARRIERILGLLTVLTVVAVAGGIIGVLLGSRTNTVDALGVRVGLVAAALVVAFVFWWFAFVRTDRIALRASRRNAHRRLVRASRLG